MLDGKTDIGGQNALFLCQQSLDAAIASGPANVSDEKSSSIWPRNAIGSNSPSPRQRQHIKKRELAGKREFHLTVAGRMNSLARECAR